MGTEEYTEEYRKNFSEENDFFFEGLVNGENSMIQTVTIPDTRWSLLVSHPINEIRREVLYSILPPIVIFLIVFIVVQYVVYFLYTRIIINSLIGIAVNLQKLAEADADLTMHVPVQTKDEIGRVAVSFNTFVEKLRELMLEIKEAINDTDNVKMSVIASTEETSKAIEQISANLDAIGKQIDVLDSNISSTVTAITEMIASLNSVNAVAQNKQQTTRALSNVENDGKHKITEPCLLPWQPRG